MDPQVEELQMTIAQRVFDLAPQEWVSAKATSMGITCYKVMSVFPEDRAGKRICPGIDRDVDLPFSELRTEMAKLHDNGHGWYTALFTLTPDGKFKFDFDYDQLPAFDIMPSPDKWLDEFKHYPRPELQAQIQDWIEGKIGYDEPGYDEVVQRLRSFHEAAR